MAGIALFEAQQADILSTDKAERAVEFYALASQAPYVSKSRWYKDLIGRHVTAAANLSPKAIATAQARSRALDLYATVAEWLEESQADVRA